MLRYNPTAYATALLLRLRSFILVCSLLTALIPNTILAESPNARVIGDPKALLELVDRARVVSCDAPSCRLPLDPVIVTLKAPQAGHIKVALTRAKLSNPLVDDDDQSPHTRPILLRGKTLSSDKLDQPPRPVAASIFLDSGAPIVEIVVADSPRQSGKAARGLMVFTLPLEALSRPSTRNARVQAPSSQAFQNRTCGTDANDFDATLEATSQSTVEIAATPPYPVLYIGTDYDPLFAKRLKCSTAAACRSRIASIINQTAVFYERQLGYTLEVARQFGPTNHGKDTLSQAVIDAFQQYNLLNRQQYVHTGSNSTSNQVDLFQLFTGREMEQDVIGVAYVGTICQNMQSSFANAVVQHVSSTLDPITTAHEIGHSLNAQHVSDGIMRANLGSTPPTSFASASLLTISSYLNQWYRECRQGLSNGTAQPTPTPKPSDPFSGKPKTLQLAVTSSGPQTVTLSSTVSTVSTGCSTRILAATSAKGASKGTLVLTIPQTEQTQGVSGTATFRVLPDSSKNTNIYFFAHYTCSSGETVEISRTVRFSPNRVAGIAKKQRSKKSWIQALKKSLNQ
jgi:hypothetical protein